ncbi:MAG: hypothetical protein HKO66_09995 [Saprospiraceae bacterium]|nr:hypothetical protein [Saprospiraceae bacterium]NNL92552.1 hypothetical protein [Saprospiraceae bacterium]
MKINFTFLLLMLSSMMMTTVSLSQSAPCSGVVSSFPKYQSFENIGNLWTSRVHGLDRNSKLSKVHFPTNKTLSTMYNDLNDGIHFLRIEKTNSQSLVQRIIKL